MKHTRRSASSTGIQPGRKERIHIRHKHKQDTGNSYVHTYIHTCTCTYIRIHVRENIREEQVPIKGAEVCIDICMYVSASRWSELPGKTKHASSRSPVLVLVSVGSGRRGATSSDRGPNAYIMWVTLLDYILSLCRQVFSLWTFLSCGRDKKHTDLCVLIVPQEQAWLRVLACPGRFVPNTIPEEPGRIVTMPKFVCLQDFSKNPQGSTQYPLFCATLLAISPSWGAKVWGGTKV